MSCTGKMSIGVSRVHRRCYKIEVILQPDFVPNASLSAYFPSRTFINESSFNFEN